MQETHIMEAISVNFVSSILTRQGRNIGNLSFDYGVDMFVQKVEPRPNSLGTGRRFVATGDTIELQLKSCYERNLRRTETHIVYPLRVENYNDLVDRINSGKPTPLALVLFILPNDLNNAMEVGDRELIIRQDAYWYQPPIGTALSANAGSVSINISIENKLDLNCDLFDILI